MKLIALATLTIAFFASTNARFTLGTCPRKKLDKFSYSDYNTKVSHPHYIKAIDLGLHNSIKVVENFGFKPEVDITCSQLGTIAPWKALAVAQRAEDQKKAVADRKELVYDGVNFYYDEKTFKLLFNDREDAILSMVFASSIDDFQQDVYYFCADSQSLPAVFEFTKAFGLDSSASVASNVNSIASIFTKLGLNFKLDGAVVAGWAANVGARDFSLFLTDYDIFIPGYSMDELIGLSKGPKSCPDFKANFVYNDDVALKNAETEILVTISDVVVLKAGLTTAQADITTVKGDITTAKAGIISAKADISAAKTDISAAQTDITTAKSDIVNLKADVGTVPRTNGVVDASLQAQIDAL